MEHIRSFLFGLISSVSLLAFYFILMSVLTGSWNAAWSQFEKLWYYMVPLSIGFGVQTGLYVNLRKIMKNSTSNKVMMANTSTSAIGMIACCMHHLTDILPILGLSALSVYLVKFQKPVLIIGIVSNIFGIYYLLRMSKKISKRSIQQK